MCKNRWVNRFTSLSGGTVKTQFIIVVALIAGLAFAGFATAEQPAKMEPIAFEHYQQAGIPPGYVLAPHNGVMFWQDPEPDVPAQDLTPSEPVAPEPVPDPPPTPAERALDTEVREGAQLIVDTLASHDRGAADMATAEADLQEAEAAVVTARQHLADVESARGASSATIVGHAQALIEVLEALIAEHAPAQ